MKNLFVLFVLLAANPVFAHKIDNVKDYDPIVRDLCGVSNVEVQRTYKDIQGEILGHFQDVYQKHGAQGRICTIHENGKKFLAVAWDKLEDYPAKGYIFSE